MMGSPASSNPMAKKPEQERLQKYLSGLGLGSRRKIDELIQAGKVRVNGRIAVPGERVTPNSQISVDGKPVRTQKNRELAAATRVILYNKPEGEICSREDPGGRPTVFRNLPKLKSQRWISIGRLDINTSGLLLFTNDGDLANRLMHPSSGIEREYMCRVYGDVSRETVERLLAGIEIDDRTMRFLRVSRRRGEGRNSWFSVTLNEGRYREVRRLWEAVGCRVSRLTRIRYGKIQIPRGLKSGAWMELNNSQIQKLVRNSDTQNPVTPAKATGNRKGQRRR